jgi:EAL domain-containing protein (putative c-di-GMP-specific phosphodiesterase class I)/FixJ family two-component response regulator
MDPPLQLKAPGRDVLADATVLVVDDHAANVALLELLLRHAGVRDVHGVTDPREVVSCCLELRPDLVLLDLHMPEMDGCAVLHALQAALPAETFLPVLVLTADDSAEARKRALDAGAKDFLTKPIDHVETVLRVRNLLETAALYRAVRTHNAQLQTELEARDARDRRLSEERRTRRARIERVLRDESLAIVFQPIVDLGSARLVGLEALARFDCEPRRPPSEWFAEAAEVGLGAELELAAMRAALRRMEHLPAAAFMSVNVSAVVMGSDLDGLLASAQGSRLVLELTEHTRIDDYARLLASMDGHRRHGVRIAVDDTGAGHAGLRHILTLRPDIIKLDNDLARDIDTDPARRALSGALVKFADEIGAVVVAEGIETQEELETLRALAVPWGQGYHLGRPGPLPAGGAMLQDSSAASHSLTRSNSNSTRATVGSVPSKPAESSSSS